MEYDQQRYSMLVKTTPPSILLLFFFWNYGNCGERDKPLSSPLLGHIEWSSSPISWWVCSRNVFVFISYCTKGHDQKDHWPHYNGSTQCFMETLWKKTFFTYFRFFHFIDNQNEHNRTDKNYDWLWKMKIISDKFSDSFAKYYNQTEC